MLKEPYASEHRNLALQSWDIWRPRCAVGPSIWDLQAAHNEILPEQHWRDQLLLSTPNITYLSLPLSVYTPPDLKELPLQHLELSEVHPSKQAWLVEFLKELRRNTTLESLTMSSWRYLEPMPGIQLESVKSLRHVKLRELLPTEALSLPRKCLLHLDLSFNWNWASHWASHSQTIEQHTLVFRICGERLNSWPTGIRQFSILQLLNVLMPIRPASGYNESLDLADVQHIPHVRLIDYMGRVLLTVTAGSWQSLEICGVQCITFKDIGAFLEGTKCFAFEFSRFEEAQGPLAIICSACRSLGVQYHKHSAIAISTAETMVQYYYKDKHDEVKNHQWLCDEDTLWPKDPLG